jgi:hypothetical protein
MANARPSVAIEIEVYNPGRPDKVPVTEKRAKLTMAICKTAKNKPPRRGRAI